MVNTAQFWEREVSEVEERSVKHQNIDIVFYGSSSIVLWQTLKSDFAKYQVVNHGFGGSRLKDAIYYYDRLVSNYHPRLVVLFSGTNDIDASIKCVSFSNRVFRLFKKFYKLHQNKLNVPLVYIAITPSISRYGLIDEVNKTNEKIKKFALKQDNLYILDVTDKFLFNNYPNEELYMPDGLHLSNKGYDIWREALIPFVDDILGE